MELVRIVKTFTKKDSFRVTVNHDGKKYSVSPSLLPCGVFDLLYNSCGVKSVAEYSDGGLSVYKFKDKY